MAKEKLKPPPANKGGKAKKKKWGSTKVKEKLNNVTVIDQKLYDRIIKDTPTMRLITISTMSDKFKVSGSIVRRAMRELLSKNLIERVGEYAASNPIYKGLLLKTVEEVNAGKNQKGKKAPKAKEVKEEKEEKGEDDE